MKIKNPRWIPVLFTLLYFGYAIFSPIHADFLTRIFRAVLLSIAAFCSVVLWVSYKVWADRWSRNATGLLIIAVLLPVVIYGIPTAVLSYQAIHLMELDTRIKKEATLITIEDEELLTDHGNPIGVRVRYQVRYPKGADALISHLPPANLSNAPSPYTGGFWVRSTEFHALNATDYVLTSDIVPEFMPATLRFVENPRYPGTGGKDPCFNWPGGPSRRTAVLNTPPQTFRIYVSEPAYSAPTQRSYDLHRFYEGALKEGGKECS
jgi:hypothetical protein